MGRQEGVIHITGGVGNLSFYKSQDGYLVRKKSGVSRERIMTDRAYARTRDNIAEFAGGALATKLLRRALYSCIQGAADNRVTSRLTSVLMKIIKSDKINPPGMRNVNDGDVTLLEGFELNKHAGLTKTLRAPFYANIDNSTGSMLIEVPAFDPAKLICAPEGATHFRLKAVGAAIDFKENSYLAAESATAFLPLFEMTQGRLLLSHNVTPTPGSSLFLLFGIELAKVVNGLPYTLSDGTRNAMAVVKVERVRTALANTKTNDTRKVDAVAAMRGPSSPCKLFSQRQSPGLLSERKVNSGLLLLPPVPSVATRWSTFPIESRSG